MGEVSSNTGDTIPPPKDYNERMVGEAKARMQEMANQPQDQTTQDKIQPLELNNRDSQPASQLHQALGDRTRPQTLPNSDSGGSSSGQSPPKQ